MSIISPTFAFQHRYPFARHFIHSSAATADRDHGSGGGVGCSFLDEVFCQDSEDLWFLSSLSLSSHRVGTIRYGEALHPGPDPGELLTVGVSNPSGLRQKEDILLGLGPGIWGLAETQLSDTTFKSSANYLRRTGRMMNRELHIKGGSPAPLRQRSTWAGSWTGVAVVSDLPTAKLEVPWPGEHWETGRVLLTRHWTGTLPITVGTFYGYAQGPTWPQARKLSDQLLETFTVELVMGMTGVRIIMGDFNFNPGQLTQQQIWLRHGWQNLQDVSQRLFDHVPVPTCKGVNERDQVWLSPEAIQILRGLTIQDDFVDHSTVMMQLHIPLHQVSVDRWPRPAKIPWKDLNTTDWNPTCPTPWNEASTSTSFMQEWANAFESSLENYVHEHDGHRLPKRCRGRAQRVRPEKQDLATPTCKPSREGEVLPLNSMAGQATRSWFKQLRRLQSMKHAVHAGKQSPDAEAYRIQLWQAIRTATGFSPDFPRWWSSQSHAIPGVPAHLPQSASSESIIMDLHVAFLFHYRAFEAWHLRERSQSLKMKYAGSLEAVFMDLRDEPKPSVGTLWREVMYTVLAVDPLTSQVQLDQEIPTNFDSIWFTDDGKTYVWALRRNERLQLQLLGFPCLSDASELGGAMTYGLARRTRTLKQRGLLLADKWNRLRKSAAPRAQKLSVLPKVFWTKALHGSANCLVADNYAMELRRAAVKAIHISGAGSNPLLRLSLADDMQADPGFFQLRLCVDTFRRMLHKTDDLSVMWQLWFQNYDGHMIPGPFSRLLHCLSVIGWSILDPPYVTDHDGHVWNLRWIDQRALHDLLQDAWLQYVASQTRHKSMQGLTGLEGYLTLLGTKQLSPLHRNLVSALHSGAFVSDHEHSKYDTEKLGFCPVCNQEDDRLHWLTCPRFQHLRQAIPGWHGDNLELPLCTLNHLLVPRQPCLLEWRRRLCALPKDLNFLVDPPQQGYHHLFVDGSCTSGDHHVLNYAAWGAVDATTGEVIAAAPLSGLTQTIDRAEITAILAALSWPSGSSLGICIWSDSQSSVEVLEYLMKHDDLPSQSVNLDLWQQVLSVLRDRQGLRTEARWIPAHLDPEAAEDDFEAWVIHWNAQADVLAGLTNRMRPDDFLRFHRQATSILSGWQTRLQQLRQFYFAVAEQKETMDQSPVVHQVNDSSDDESPDLWIPWEDLLPLTWIQQCQQPQPRVPSEFLVNVIHWICAAERLGDFHVDITDFELVFALLIDREFQFPFLLGGNRSQGYCMRRPDSLFQRPTFSQMLRPIQFALSDIHDRFPATVRTLPIAKPELGVQLKMAGLRIRMPQQLWEQVQSNVRTFTTSRPVKRVCDLARPVP
eukprot:Skav203175  [mRNA]  locus=scaffold39:98339:103385:- [translate_table: standard]